MPDNKLKQFHDSIKGNKNIVGVPDDFNTFESALKDPLKSKAFYDAISKNSAVTGIPKSYEEFGSALGLIEKKNPKTPTELSGTANSTASKPNLVSSQKVRAEQGLGGYAQNSLANINKDAVKGAEKAAINQKKASALKGDEGVVDFLVSGLVGGTSQIVSGISGLVGGAADLMIQKKPTEKKAPFLSNEYFKELLMQKGEVKDPSPLSNQGIRDMFMGFSSAMSTVAQGESEVQKEQIGVDNVSKSGIDYLLEGDVKNASKTTLVDITQQIQQLLVSVASGGSLGGLSVLGASSTGSSLSEDYQQDGDISSTDMVQGISNGIGEVLSERLFDMNIKAGNAIGAKISDLLGPKGKVIQELIRNEGVEQVSKKIIREFSGVLKESSKGFGQEVLQENIVTLTNFLTKSLDEDVWNEESYQKLLKDMGQNVLVAGPMGGSMSMIAANSSFKRLTNEEKTKISRYDEIISDPTSSKEVKDIAQKRIQDINDGYGSNAQETHDKLIKLDLPERIETIDKLNKINELTDDLTKQTDLDIRDGLEEKIKSIQEEIDTTLSPSRLSSSSTSQDVTQTTAFDANLVNETTDKLPDIQREIVIKTTNDFIEQKLSTSDKIQEIEKRINNAELINEKDITESTDGLYDLLDEVDKLEINNEVKQSMISAIEDKIKKIEGYEFETTTKVINPEQERKILVSKQVIGETKRGSRNKSEITKDRFIGKDVIINESDGTIEYDEKNDLLSIVHEDGRTDLDFNYVEFKNSIIDGDGNLQGVKLIDTRNGDEISINDQDLAYDIAIKEKTRQLGEVSDAIFDEVYQTITTPAVTKEVIKNKPNTSSNTQQKITPSLSPPITPTQTTDVKNDNKGSKITPEQADKDSQKMMVDTENEILKKGKTNWISKFKRYVLNRKTDLDKELNKSEKGQKARKYNENVSGSVSYADQQFQDMEKSIYGSIVLNIDKKVGKVRLKITNALSDISQKQEQDLNLAIFHNRVINIDKNTRNKNIATQKRIDDLKEERNKEKDATKKIKITKKIAKEKGKILEEVKHPRGFNEEKSKAALDGMKQRLGEEAFADIESRSNAYAEARREMLLEMAEEGLISEDTFDRLVGDSYIERKFLDHIFDNQNFSTGDSLLPSQMIKSLAGGSEGLLLTDSRLLLHSGYRSLQARISTNRANKMLLEAIKEGKLDPEFGKVAKFKKNLDGSYKVDSKSGMRIIEETPIGMTLVPSYEKGERGGVFIKQELAEQWNDSIKVQTVLDPYLKTAFGVKLLKAAATLVNPLFAAGNTARDFLKTVYLTDTYDNNLLTSAPRLLLNFSSKATQYTAHKFGISTDSFNKLVDDYTKYGGKFEFLHQDGKNTRLYKNSVNKNKSFIVKLGNKSYNLFENTMGLPGEISEISMRLAIFDKKRSDMIDSYGGKSNMTKEQIIEANVLAANASRAVMDYNKGGLATKWLDNFSPYLNASVVGFVSDVDYIKKNPKMVAAKMAILGLNTAALTLWNLMQGDDEEYKNIPQYIKDNNFIFFIPGKYDGEKRYVTIPKYQGLQMPIAMFEEATMAMWNNMKDTNYGKETSTVDRSASTLSTWSPIPFTPRGVLQKLPPTVNAGIAYFANYDSYRDQDIEYKKGDIPANLEGLDNKRIARSFKVLGDMSSKLGPDYALSPTRTQAAVEKIITNPRTNFLIGNLYGISDWITQNYQIPMEIEKSNPNSIKSSIKDKFVRTVDPRYAEKANDFSKKEDMKIKAQEQYEKKMIKVMVNNGEPSKKVVEFILKLDISDSEKETRAKMYKDLVAEKSISSITPFYDELLDIRYLQVSPEGKAQSFYNRFHGIDPKSEDFSTMIDSAEKMKIISKGSKNGGIKANSSYERFVKEYVRIYDLKKKDTK